MAAGTETPARGSGDRAGRPAAHRDTEIEQVERLIATEALKSRQVRRLLTVPGVNVICAAVFLAALGDIRRFKGQRQVVAYLGVDPRVYQSGLDPRAADGSPSKARPTEAI